MSDCPVCGTIPNGLCPTCCLVNDWVGGSDEIACLRQRLADAEARAERAEATLANGGAWYANAHDRWIAEARRDSERADRAERERDEATALLMIEREVSDECAKEADRGEAFARAWKALAKKWRFSLLAIYGLGPARMAEALRAADAMADAVETDERILATDGADPTWARLAAYRTARGQR